MMTRKHMWRTTCAFVTTMGLMQPTALLAASPDVVVGPRSSDLVSRMTVPAGNEPKLDAAQKLALLRANIKYVFVLFQENRSFDFYFGTFPGATGLVPATNQPGIVQKIVNTDNSVSTISPFLIPASVKDTNGNTVPLYPMDTDSIDHSHAGIVNSADTVNGVTKNDRYALNEEGLTTNSQGQVVSRSTGAPLSSLPLITLAQKQKAELVMSHVDCNTVPFLWEYADRFTMYDNFHMTVFGPSTPNAIALISGQSGLTQLALHPELASSNGMNPVVQESGGLPVEGDPGPYAGSNFDTSAVKPPYGPNDESPATPGPNLTFASQPLSFMGSNIRQIIQSDQNPALDLADVQSDIAQIAGDDMPVNWGWYQEGYDHEPTDGSGPATFATYITHHNGPQYFGYLGDNTNVQTNNLHGLGDFFTAIGNNALGNAGVFYVRGGYGNNDGLKPVDPNSAVQAAMPGSDDHPGYSDAQIAETLLADEINAIASSKYWSQSAIIITYDETDGLYDHVPASVRAYDSLGTPVQAGPRIPTIVISPFASVHTISHKYGEHASVIKFINELFKLRALETLPNERNARALGVKEFNQANYTPFDNDPSVNDLTDAFDNARLAGTAAPLAPNYATIPAAISQSLPHYGGEGCAALNISPTDYVNGTLTDPAPADFNPRPNTTPGLPTTPGWGG